MTYRLEYTQKALKQLKKMDAFEATLITSWIGKHLKDVIEPRRIGGPLKGNHSGKWRYKVGVYRILCNIQDDVLVIEILAVGHRKDVYKS